jgi:putative hemolysin
VGGKQALDEVSIGLQILLILVLILANGIFALSEIAIVSSRKARLERMAEEGHSGAKIALELKDEPTQLLSTIQVGITLIGIVTGAFGGATIAEVLAVHMRKVNALAPYSDGLSMLIAVSIITYLSLIVGELVPKKIGLNNPEPIAVIISGPMRTFAKMASPIVKFLTVSTEFVLKLLRIREVADPPVTEEEIKILMAQGAEHGTFEETESEIVDRVFELGDLKVGSLLTPKMLLDWIDVTETETEILSRLTQTRHSRLPVAREELDEVIGVVYARDLLASQLANEPLDVLKHVRAPLFIPRNTTALKLLALFQQSGSQIAFVMNEYGGFQGIVTVHDILEKIVGDIQEDSDSEDDIEVIQRDDKSWLLDGLLPIEEFEELFEIGEIAEQDKKNYHTLAGFIIAQLGYIPTAGESFEWRGLRFEILDMDRVRIDKILVTRMGLEN